MLALADNGRMGEIGASLRDQTRIVGMHSLAEAGALEATAAEHRPILDAVRARDVETARSRMTTHLEHTRGAWSGRDEPEGAAA